MGEVVMGMSALIQGLLSIPFVRQIGLGLLAGLVLLGVVYSIHSHGYQQGHRLASLECVEEKEAAARAVNEEIVRRLQEQQAELRALNASNKILSEKFEQEKEIVIKEVERVIENQPIIVDSEQCSIDPSIIGLLNTLATTSPSAP